MNVPDQTPTGITPSADTPAETKKKMGAGRAGIILIAGLGIAAFLVYAIIIVYAAVVGT